MTKSEARVAVVWGYWFPTEALSEVLDLRGAPLVSMMQPAQHRYRHDPSTLGRLDRSPLRSIFFQRQVNAVPMIIVHECLEVPVQAAFVEHDQVIQAFAAERADDPLDVSTLPRRTRRAGLAMPGIHPVRGGAS